MPTINDKHLNITKDTQGGLTLECQWCKQKSISGSDDHYELFEDMARASGWTVMKTVTFHGTVCPQCMHAITLEARKNNMFTLSYVNRTNDWVTFDQKLNS